MRWLSIIMQAAAHLEPTETTRPSLTLIEGGACFREQLASVTPTLYPRALQLTRNPQRAHDLVQDTALRALRFESTFTAGSNLRAWLGQVLFSVFVSQRRRAKREQSALMRVGADPCSWTHQDQAPLMQRLSPRLQQCVRELPDNFSSVLLLVDVAEFSYKDAADALNIPVGTVMSRLHRARRMLRERLEPTAA